MPPMPAWPRFIAHKIVHATPIRRIELRAGGESLPLLFVDPSCGREAPVAFFPSEPGMAARCQVGDLAMAYRDGYRSVCPKQEFDDGYTLYVAPGS